MAAETGVRKEGGAMHGLELSLAHKLGVAEKEGTVEIATQPQEGTGKPGPAKRVS
jgi:hypothetical protein